MTFLNGNWEKERKKADVILLGIVTRYITLTVICRLTPMKKKKEKKNVARYVALLLDLCSTKRWTLFFFSFRFFLFFSFFLVEVVQCWEQCLERGRVFNATFYCALTLHFIYLPMSLKSLDVVETPAGKRKKSTFVSKRVQCKSLFSSDKIYSNWEFISFEFALNTFITKKVIL